MPEVSNCEIYKLESKLEEMSAVIKRAQEQLERIKDGKGREGTEEDGPPPGFEYEEERT